jgi:hypothetical protein
VLENSFRKESSLPSHKLDTRIEGAPVLHLEAYRFSPEEQDKYNKWFTEYGLNIFIPLYLKQSGVNGYDYYKYTQPVGTSNTRDQDYPAHLSLIYFENLKAFEKYETSPELSTFQKTLRAIFPLGLNYRWYVQYELKLSLRQ